VADDVHGLLVPPGDPAALAGAMLRLLTNPRFAAGLGDAARQRAAERFSREAMVRRHEDFYRRLVGPEFDTPRAENRG
jgi:rhamnosyl/mannosyltransferase